jgi:hypothetical protein
MVPTTLCVTCETPRSTLGNQSQPLPLTHQNSCALLPAWAARSRRAQAPLLGNLPFVEAHSPAFLRIRIITVNIKCLLLWSLLSCCSPYLQPERVVQSNWRKHSWDRPSRDALISSCSKHPHLSVSPPRRWATCSGARTCLYLHHVRSFAAALLGVLRGCLSCVEC